MEENKETKMTDVLSFAILILPMLALPQLAEYIGGETPEIAMSMILGGLGAAIGSPFFWLTKDKSKAIKMGTLGFVLIGIIGAFMFFGNQTESEKYGLLTCEICGYKSLEKKGEMCEVCLVEIDKDYKMELEMEDEDISLEELIKEDQILFFATDEGVTLLEPKIYDDEGFKYLKDENWKAMVTQTEVEEEKKNW